jgi:hypothetical protein
MYRIVVLTAYAAVACAPRAVGPAGVEPLARAFADAPVEVAAVAPGVRHAVIVSRAGPWTIHVVDVDTRVCRPVLEVRKADGRLSSLALTTELAGNALATINADFFRAPGGTPVGAHVHAGVPMAGATEWPVFGVDSAGRWAHGRARLDAVGWVGADSARLTQVNRQATSFTAYQGTTTGLALHTSRSDTLPADSAWRIRLRAVAGDEARGQGVIAAVDSPAARTLVPDGEAALLVRGAAVEWARRRTVGDTVRWSAQVLVDDGSGSLLAAREAVGGFPALLVGGRDVLGLQTVRRAFGEARHPRTAVAWTADGARLMFVVVDGRQEHSDGMTLPELVTALRRLGADEAINLDGGGSTALVIRGALVNRPSDEQGERPVGNALALVRCD